MSSKVLSETVRQVRKARIQLSEVEDQLYEILEDKFEIKEELQDQVREIIDNIDAFDDVSAVETLLTACGKKIAPARGHRRNAGKKTKEEVIQTVKERRQTPAPSTTPAASEDEA